MTQQRGDSNPSSEPRPPEAIHHVEDAASGLDAWLVVDDTRLGPAFGGIRCRAYAGAEEARCEALELARHMTWKCAVAGLDAGGGKAVIRAERLRDRAHGFAVLGAFIEALGGRFRTAGDLGTGPPDLDAMRTRTRHVADEAQTGDLGDATAIGLAAGITALTALRGLPGPGAGLHVAVQGLGAIGGALARRLAGAGCRLAVADPNPAARERWSDAPFVDVLDPDEILEAPVHVLAPCAAGGILDEARAARVRAPIVVPGANCVLADPAAGTTLWRRGVWLAPDFVVNAGAVIRGVAHALHGDARGAPVEAIGARAASILQEALTRDVPPEAVARARAEARLAAAGC